MNEMTSLERVLATMTHKQPDRVPVFPILLLQGAAELGMGLEQYFSRGTNWAEGQLKLRDKYGHDCVVGVPHIVQDITAFGAKVMYWEKGSPSPGGMVIHSWDDVRKLTVPDPYATPELVETLKAIELLAKEVKGEVPIIGAVIAPFSLPSMLMGTELWMDLLLFEEDVVRNEVMGHMLEIALEFSANWANAQLAAGADVIVLADGMSSAAVLTRQQFIDFALPTVKAIVPRIKGSVVHEGVGHLHPMLDLLVDTGILGVILSHLDDLALCKKIVGDKLALIGNLNNIEMLRWSPEQMTQKSRDALAAVSGCSGFVLSAQGPEIPLGVSDEVIHAMVQAPRNWQCE
jgi:uroporphyrinogen decarboxylase